MNLVTEKLRLKYSMLMFLKLALLVFIKLYSFVKGTAQWYAIKEFLFLCIHMGKVVMVLVLSLLA